MSNNLENCLIGMDEACQILGLKKSYLYKLTSWGLLPFYKPWGKKIYFNKIELIDFIKNKNKRINK